MRGKLLISNVIWAVSYQADSTCAHHRGSSLWLLKEIKGKVRVSQFVGPCSAHINVFWPTCNKPQQASGGRQRWTMRFGMIPNLSLHFMAHTTCFTNVSALNKKESSFLQKREPTVRGSDSERFRRSKVVWWSLEISAPLNQSESTLLPYDAFI